MKTLAYSIQKQNVVPITYCITIHVERDGVTESLRQHTSRTLSGAHELAIRIGEYESVPRSMIEYSSVIGLPKYRGDSIKSATPPV